MSEKNTILSENIEIVTPVGKHKVELKTWITGRESMKLNQAMMKHMKVNQDSLKQIGQESKIEIESVDLPNLTAELNTASIEIYVVSVDGNKENVLDIVLDMLEEDYNFVLAEIEKHKKKS